MTIQNRHQNQSFDAKTHQNLLFAASQQLSDNQILTFLVVGMANLLEQKEDEEAIASLECKWEVDVTTGEITTHSSAVSMTEKMLHRCDYEKARAAYYDAQFDIKSLTQNSKWTNDAIEI